MTFTFLSLVLNWRLCHLRRGDSICAEAGRAGLVGRYAQPRKRLAARSFARARRAVGGFAGKPASTLGHASAMRCVAANRHGSPLRGTRNPTEIGLTNGLWLIHQATLGPFREFPCPAAGGLPCPASAWKPEGLALSPSPCASLLAGTEGDSAPIAARRFQVSPASVVARKHPAPLFSALKNSPAPPPL